VPVGRRRVQGRRLRALGLELPDHVEGGDRLAPDDVLDAAIVAWTATGLHDRAGLRSQEWDRGRPIAIWTRQ
jgi:hypothetical protein